jgi:hypothetical protein
MVIPLSGKVDDGKDIQLDGEVSMSVFTVHYMNGSTELRRTSDGTVVPLSKKMRNLIFSPYAGASIFVVNYQDETAELHRTSDGAPLQSLSEQMSDHLQFDPQRVGLRSELPGRGRRIASHE